MSNVSKKMLMAASGVGGATLDVDDCFSCFLYEGDGTPQAINNGIDLTEGGLVWIKIRSGSGYNVLYDTARGATKGLYSNDNSGEVTRSGGLTSFNSNGFSVGQFNWENGTTPAKDLVSWTFRKAPKFFDVKTVTTDSSGNATVNHDLSSSPGFVIVKGLNVTDEWYCFHVDRGVNKFTNLSTRDPETSFAAWTNVSSTTFGLTFGSTTYANKNMVVYLFAHNNNDGEFGPSGDQDCIKVGSYNGTNAAGNEINLGFEPQWLLIKATTKTDSWFILDNMRGLAVGGTDNYLQANDSAAEAAYTGSGFFDLTATGFKSASSALNESGQSYIYMAIRSGPLAVAEDATKVFAANITTNSSNTHNLGFVPDFVINKKYSANSQPNYAITRLLGKTEMRTNANTANSTYMAAVKFWDCNTNTIDLDTSWWAGGSDVISWSWKRAPGYFDVVAATGGLSGGSLASVQHNLGVTPELIIQKKRSGSSSMDWFVTGSGVGGTNKYLILNSTAAVASTITLAHNASTFTPIFDQDDFIAYLFATVAGVSKISSVVHSGTTNVDAGFANGSRFVLLKRTDANGDWFIWDSTRGIVSGNDPYLALNSTAAEVTNTDYIDPYSSGFTLTSNLTAGTYIYYAIA